MIKEALLYKKQAGDQTVCRVCGHTCKLTPGQYGICGVRQNKKGILYTLAYGDLIAVHIDPIEKKPLYHFLPASLSLSVATIGCNFRCSFCQNWQISQASKKGKGSHIESPPGKSVDPREVVEAAVKQGCRSLSYTYTEPTIFFEYALDTSKLARDNGLANVFVTNGYMSRETLDTISPYLDACNVDLKSFRNEFYKNICKASLQPVLDSIRRMKDLGIWVEVTTLIVPGLNDSSAELKEIAGFIYSVDPEIPWHISRFHPDYQYSETGATPVAALRMAYDIGKDMGLSYIYIGNVLGMAEDTFCSNCGEVLIRRSGFSVSENRIKDSSCPSCGTVVSGRFDTMGGDI
ncbi:AmmeMemoRadiSam system radical SAM enzyme [Acidobacteriota bacterium]